MLLRNNLYFLRLKQPQIKFESSLNFNFTCRLALEHRSEAVLVATAAFVHERFAFLFGFVVSKFAEGFVACSRVDFIETASCKSLLY